MKARHAAVMLLAALAACTNPDPKLAADDAKRQADLAAQVAGDPEPAAVRTMSFEDRAGYYLHERNYPRLRQTLEGWSWDTPDQATRTLEWSNQMLVRGESIFVGYPYADNLWRIGNAAPTTAVGYRDTAAMMAAYIHAVTLVDGQRCADPSAVGRALDKSVGPDLTAVWAYLASVSAERRDDVLDYAVNLEMKTAPRRGDDAFICTGGSEDRNAPRPAFLPPATAQPKAAEARAQLPARLAGAVDRLKH